MVPRWGRVVVVRVMVRVVGGRPWKGESRLVRLSQCWHNGGG